MTTEQKSVKEFMQTFDQACPDKPTIPSLEIRKLRAKLILEEALECIEALGFKFTGGGNPVENYLYMCENTAETNELSLELIADGLADLHYVAYCGTGIACGLDMEDIFNEVHRSNMSKFWTYKEKLKAPLEYVVTNNTSLNPDEMTNTDRCYIVKDRDGKVIKSPSYSPVNLQKLIK